MYEIELVDVEKVQQLDKTQDITIKKDRGILKEIITEGAETETPGTGDKVFVHYVGTLTDGSKFDSSRDRGERFSFILGKSEVIKSWDQGVATMKIGEKAMFIIKPDYGYGSEGNPPNIPGNYQTDESFLAAK